MEGAVFVVVFPCEVSAGAGGRAEEEGDDEVDFFEHGCFGFEEAGWAGVGVHEAAQREGVFA